MQIISDLEVNTGAFPRRIMVPSKYYFAERAIIQEAGQFCDYESVLWLLMVYVIIAPRYHKFMDTRSDK